MAYVYDLNSAYPKAMLDNPFPNPAKLRVRRNISDPFELDVCMKNYEGMATCTVHIGKDEALPVLPYRMDSRLIFPCGNITGSWTFPELRYAIANSNTTIKKISMIVSAPAIDSPFKEYISHHYELRKNTKNELKRLKKESPVSCLVELRRSFKNYTSFRGGGDINYKAFNCMEEYVND